MIVVDATVLADFLIGEEELERAVQRLVRTDPDWISVGLWRYELGNVLWKEVRFKGREADELRSNLAKAGALLVETVDRLDEGRVFDVACGDQLSYYDASYVWLARSRGLKLRTRDSGILKKCPDVALPMPE